MKEARSTSGSILSHDHMQGGHYTFAMEKAPIEQALCFKGFEDVKAGIVRWPMSVIRISGTDKARLVALADKILVAWRGYTDKAAFIFAETNGEPHNTITPIGPVQDSAVAMVRFLSRRRLLTVSSKESVSIP